MAYIHQINPFDMDNDFGNGPVVSVFFNYCPFHCADCWNPQTWERDEALYRDTEELVDELEEIITLELIQRGMSPNLSLLGGDPMVNQNVFDTIYIVQELKNRIPTLKIAVWTGYDIDTWYRINRYQVQLEVLKSIDYLIDGRFIRDLKTQNQMFGSINQRIIDTSLLEDTYSKQMIMNATVTKEMNINNLSITTTELSEYYLQSNNNHYWQSVIDYVQLRRLHT